MRRTAPRHMPGMTVTDLIPIHEDDPGGSTDSQWGRAHVLVKHSTAENPNVVINEYISNRIAVALGIPTPLGDLWFNPNTEKVDWVVAEIGIPGTHFPPPQREDLMRISEKMRARMQAFDALIYNMDRQEENILADDNGHAWLIDHDLALFGDIRVNRAEGLLTTLDRRDYDLSRFWSSLDVTADQMDKACQYVRTSLASSAIEAPVSHLRHLGLLNLGEQEAVVEFLTHRRDIIRSIVRREDRTGRSVSGGPDLLFSDGGDFE